MAASEKLAVWNNGFGWPKSPDAGCRLAAGFVLTVMPPDESEPALAKSETEETVFAAMGDVA